MGPTIHENISAFLWHKKVSHVDLRPVLHISLIAVYAQSFKCLMCPLARIEFFLAKPDQLWLDAISKATSVDHTNDSIA